MQDFKNTKTALVALPLGFYNAVYISVSSLTVTLSPTVRAKYPSSQNSPLHNSFFTSGYSYNTGTYPLRHTNHLRNTIPRWKTQKICTLSVGYLHCVYLKSMMLCYLMKYYYARLLFSLSAILTSGISVPIPNDISYHILHGLFASVPCRML